MTVLDRLMQASEARSLKAARKTADQVNSWEPAIKALTDVELAAKTAEFQQRLQSGETTEQLLPEAFAVVREAGLRVLGMRAYDVQIMGGIILHRAGIAEMRTGEGKTLIAVFPSYLNALTGEGVHVVTVNDYLAERDGTQMGKIHRFLGLSVGILTANVSERARKDAYQADITYGTNTQFGFDYLRDHMARSRDQQVQRGHHFAIVDEVDSILIDEARTPLIISGAGEAADDLYLRFADILAPFEPGTHFTVDEKKQTVSLLEPGIVAIEQALDIDDLYADENSHNIMFALATLRAKALYPRDVKYVVDDGKVKIVDDHTGRIMDSRRYDGGIHQALEAKEGVEIIAEDMTLASITLQNYFRLYTRLSGMTGTGATERSEFFNVYGLNVTVIPPHRPVARIDEPDLVFRNARGKYQAIIADIQERHAAGQPILVGTTSVEKSEYISRVLTKSGIEHEVLNAKQHAREAEIVADAGRLGRVTIATNMAGRGTDILLGGDVDHRTRDLLAEAGHIDPDAADYQAAWVAARQQAKELVAAERELVLAAGGLYVLGTERNESRRIDNQLRGRAGRQGDPGASRFYLAIDDDMMRVFRGDVLEKLLLTLNIAEDTPVQLRPVTRAIEGAQRELEAKNQDARASLFKYDKVLNIQRAVIYAERDQLLRADGDLIRTLWRELARAVAHRHIRRWAAKDRTIDLFAMLTDLGRLYPTTVTVASLFAAGIRADRPDLDQIANIITDDMDSHAQTLAAGMDPDSATQLFRGAILAVLDRRWREHLVDMNLLADGVQLRTIGQRDPLVEYERDASTFFDSMMDSIARDSVATLFTVNVTAFLAQQAAAQPELHLHGGQEPGTDI